MPRFKNARGCRLTPGGRPKQLYLVGLVRFTKDIMIYVRQLLFEILCMGNLVELLSFGTRLEAPVCDALFVI